MTEAKASTTGGDFAAPPRGTPTISDSSFMNDSTAAAKKTTAISGLSFL
jgi:hypothetical protein